MVKIIDGRKVAKQLNESTKQKVRELAKKGVTPGIAVILVGNNDASRRYVHMKEKKANELGINSIMKTFSEDVSEKVVIDTINKLNSNP